MLKSKSFLAVDFGAGTLKLAEFELNESGGLRLKQYGFKPLGPDGAQESAREAVVLKALQELLAEKGVTAKTANVCAPGFHVFSKFVKLPPVDAGKVTQIIQYEAQQNVPFPLEEVVWDYQILGTTAGGELEVLLVAIKADIIEGIYRATETVGLKQQLADVSPAALCNAFRYNYGDLDDCTMLLDIGSKTSNLLFFEKGKVFSRGINLGANSITQDFANESKLKWDAAEKLKIDEGFVSLGGAYEEPENPHQAAISKIARQFMTRLHIQVNQTMQFYRGQQGGSAPQRLFLSGGASIMPYTAQFFAEKLNVPVEYFNPLRNVQISPDINLEDLARVAHSMGEVVGLGLRNLAQCPVELNLMPESTLKWQSFNQKKPYFIATIFSMVVGVAAIGWLFAQLAEVKNASITENEGKITPLQTRSDQFKKVFADWKKTTNEVSEVVNWVDSRYYWADVMTEMRQILIRVEAGMKAKLRTDTGVWVDRFISAPALAEGAVATVDQATQPPPPGYRRGFDGGMAAPTPAPQPTDAAATGGVTNAPGTLEIRLRAVSLSGVSGVSTSANPDIAFAVANELKNSPMVESCELDPTIGNEESGTFTFVLKVRLKRPLKL
jgi:type IV pilus assembly protein PilM